VPFDRIAALGLLVVSGLLVARLGPGAVGAWRIYAGTGQRRQRDATARAPSAPPGIVDRLALFEAEGYHLIGVTSLDLPVGERFAWIVAAEDAESYAILAGGFSRVSLSGIYSAWPDGTWLGTLHPTGQPADRPGLQVRIVTTTIADAVALHRTGLERLRAAHGAARSIRTIPDMLALDADYRERFGGSRLVPITLRIVVPAVLAAVGFVISALLLLSTLR
jgi:hypothetical protein